MKKEFCRYAVWDSLTGVMLACGEKYKKNIDLAYVESFRCRQSHLKKVSAYAMKTVVKGRVVDIVFWFNTPRHKPFRTVTDAGLILGLR